MKIKCLAFVLSLWCTAHVYAQQQKGEYRLTVLASESKKIQQLKRGSNGVNLYFLNQSRAETPLCYYYRAVETHPARFSAYSDLKIAGTSAFKVLRNNFSAPMPVKSQNSDVILAKLPLPVISTDRDYYCQGETATLSVQIPGNAGYGIKWYLNGSILNNLTNRSSFSTLIGGIYVVSVFDPTLPPSDPNYSASSPARTLFFDPPPPINIQPVANNPVCNGESVILQAMHEPGTLLWSTGETTDDIAVTTSGKYTVTITSPHGCVNITSMDIQFLPAPTVAVKDTFFCFHTKQSVLLHAPSGFINYIWNGKPGVETYLVSLPQTVTLTVVSPNNCTATTQIEVADVCSSIYIPNTFTPNGDGINDTWAVEGLGDDKTILVTVFTRSGAMVYQSHGYNTNWNGEYNGKRLPVGVYYYVITAKNGAEKYSGSLTILY